MSRHDIRVYFLGLTRDNMNFREHLKYLVDSRAIFRAEYAWLLKLLLQYAYGVPVPLPEDLADMSTRLVFLSQNPIGRPEFDPLLHAKPVGPAALVPAAPAEEEEPPGPFRDLAGQEHADPANAAVEPFRAPDEYRSPRADYR